MREVTLYTATPKKVMCSNHRGIPYHLQTKPSFNSADSFILDQVFEVQHLPIKRVCWGNDYGVYKEVFFAFDPELEELLDILVTEEVQRSYKWSLDKLKSENDALSDQLKVLQSLTLWSTIVTKFKQWWNK